MRRVNVVFEGEKYGRVYTFLADDNMSLSEGDWVAVDTQNGLKVAQITNQTNSYNGPVNKRVVSKIEYEDFLEEDKKKARREQLLVEMAKLLKEKELLVEVQKWANSGDPEFTAFLSEYNSTFN